MAAVYERNGAWHPVPAPIPLREVIRNAFLNALAYTDGDQCQAAKLLGVSPRMMNYNLMTYGIPTAKNRLRPANLKRWNSKIPNGGIPKFQAGGGDLRKPCSCNNTRGALSHV